MGRAAAFAAVLPSPLVSASNAKVHDIDIRSFAFVHAQVRVTRGDTLRWTNRDLAPHTATADEFGWDTAELAQGETAQVVVTEGMETSYFCVFHPHMTGTIEIV